MAAIRSKDTAPEVYLRKLLFSRGYRYRKNDSRIAGHPDIYLPKYKVAIFVNGCFWHRHPGCRYAYIPKSRVDFWTKKFEANVNRDKVVHKQLAESNIRVLVVWECTIRRMKKDSSVAEEIAQEIEAFLHEIGKIEAIVEIQAVQVLGNRYKCDTDRDDQDQGTGNLQIGGDFHKE